MTWSYSGGPSASNLDEVRWRAGLTDTSEQLVTDEEINFCISQEDNNVAAAAGACEGAAAKLAREVDLRAGARGELSLKLSQAAEALKRRALELRKKSNSYAKPWSAAISRDEKDDQLDDSDRVTPFFKRKQFEDGEDSGVTKDWNKYGLRGE